MDNDAVPPAIETPPPRIISGFWRRLAACFIDALVLGVLGAVAGLFLFDFFASLGGWGRLVGFGVALAYFTLFNSAWGKGKTVGKRIMGIEVVDSTGGHISVRRSFLRYLVLGVPFFLNGAPFPPAVIASPLGYLIGFLIFGLGGSIGYLYVFNGRTRQSLHDLVVGTFVVRGGGSGRFTAGTVWRPHFFIVGFLCLAVIGLSCASVKLLKKGVFSNILLVEQKLQSSGNVRGVTVDVGTAWFDHDDVRQEATFLQSTAIWKIRPTDYQAAADEMASIILANYPDIDKKDSLSVTICYGYDIGISHVWSARSFHKSPQQWIRDLGGTK
jgi:uncharacterized RDD family membrane protein YckC